MEILPDFELNAALVVFCIFSMLLFIQFIYAIAIYGRFAFCRTKKGEVKQNQPPVSIVIAARNESDNLYQHLPQILNQRYPNFEVVVVNHQSIDNSYQVLHALQLRYPDKLKVVEVERSRHLGSGKKFPLSLGIKASKHDFLVLTDADCKPTSDQWLALMVGQFSETKQLVMGYAPYTKKPGMLNRLIRFDTAMIAMNYFSFARSGVPYMAVGRNLAYSKKLFESVNGFKSHYAIISGDDDLFIQEAAKNRNYTIQIDPDAFCYSDAKTTWKSWLTQKSRHYSTSARYQVIKKALLGIYPLTLILAWISFVTLLFDAEYRWLSAAAFTFVMLVKWMIQGKCLARLKATSFVYAFPFVDLFYAILMPSIYYTSDKASQSKWK